MRSSYTTDLYHKSKKELIILLILFHKLCEHFIFLFIKFSWKFRSLTLIGELPLFNKDKTLAFWLNKFWLFGYRKYWKMTIKELFFEFQFTVQTIGENFFFYSSEEFLREVFEPIFDEIFVVVEKIQN